MPPPKPVWWKDGVAYQIYPASFLDSNGDGLGDLPGILRQIPYLASLGITILWISPMFASPQVDMGYDISDYQAVHPPYGTLADMDAIIAACHSHGMRLILDLVINHSSDQHAWFQESRSSKDSPKRDWYIWRPARYAPDGTRMPPNNWRSYFSGPAWEWDETTGEYYMHLFAKEQPDLNWENPTTRAAIYESAMKFWLDRGVDGFRVDCVNMYSKGIELQDAPIVDATVFEQPGWDIYANGPRMHEFLREMMDQVLRHYDATTVGELPHTPDPQKVLQYVGGGADRQLDMVFQFDIVDIGQGRTHKYRFEEWRLPQLKGIVDKWQRFIEGTEGWTTAFCENHDQGRSVSRYASDAPEYRALSAKMLALMLSCLTGTLFIYQGQEIGMINVPKEWRIEDDYKDIESVNFFNSVKTATEGYADAEQGKRELEYVRKSIQILGRDNARIPMQWDDSPHGGFTTRPEGGWMRTHDLYKEINVAKQLGEEDSVLSFWKQMLRLRKENREVLVHGAFEMLEPENEETFVFVKKWEDKRAVAVLNFTSETQTVTLPETGGAKLSIGNYQDVEEREMEALGAQERILRPWEGRLYMSE